MWKIVPILALLIVSCSEEGVDYSWFESDWISDADSTLLASPEYQELDAESQALVLDIYGNLKWFVSGNRLRGEFTSNSNLNFETDFLIQHIDEESFYLITDKEQIYIQKNDNGFCLQARTTGDEVPFECFVPLGT